MKKNLLLVNFVLVSVFALSGCDGFFGDQPWNDETKALISGLLGNENIIPYFDGFTSYTSVRAIEDVSNYDVLTISGAVSDASTSISQYSQVVNKSNLWTNVDSSSSEELGYYTLKTEELTPYTYLSFYFSGETFIVECGVKLATPTDWTDDEKTMMDTYIGTGIYLPFYYIDNSYLEECYFEGYEGPQGVSYCSTSETATAVKAYADYVKTLSDFTLASSDTDAYYFEKTINETTVFCVDVYLWNGYFDVDGYLDVTTPTPSVEDSITADITLLPANFYVSTGSEYGADNLACSGGGMNYTTTLTKKSFKTEDAIQMKRGSSHFENINELPILTSITINQIVENAGYDGTYTVYGGTSVASLSVITGVNGVYSMNGATYFKIANESTYACYARSIVFDFTNL